MDGRPREVPVITHAAALLDLVEMRLRLVIADLSAGLRLRPLFRHFESLTICMRPRGDTSDIINV